MKNTRVFACQGHDPRDSCQILSFLVVLPDGFWAVDGFSQTKSRLLLLAAFPKSRKSKKWEMQNRQFWFFGGSPHFGGLRSRKSRKSKGPGNGLRKRSGYCKNRQFWCFRGVPPISAALEAGNPGNTRGLWPPVFPPFGRPWKPEIQEIQGAWKWPPEKERVFAKSTILVLLWGHFRGLGRRKSKKYKRPWKWPPGKESTILMLLWGSPHFRRPWKPEIQEIQGVLEMASGKRSGYCKIDNFGAFVEFPPFRRPWKPENPETQGALEIATGKGAGIALSTILVLLRVPPHFRRPWKPEIQEIQGALEMATGKRTGIAKSTNLKRRRPAAFPPFWRPWEAGNPRHTKGPWMHFVLLDFNAHSISQNLKPFPKHSDSSK